MVRDTLLSERRWERGPNYLVFDSVSRSGCKSGLEETSDSVVVSFGSSLWHVDW